jgi:hypothetical protein
VVIGKNNKEPIQTRLPWYNPTSKEEQLEIMLARLEGNMIEKQAVRAIFQSLFRD